MKTNKARQKLETLKNVNTRKSDKKRKHLRYVKKMARKACKKIRARKAPNKIRHVKRGKHLGKGTQAREVREVRRHARHVI